MKILPIILFVLFSCGVSFAQEEHNFYNVSVVSVYDGDTITVEIPLLPGLTQVANIRLFGIDTPELKSPSLCEKEMAVKAREYLESILTRKSIYLTGLKYDKFGGRYIAVLLFNINDQKTISALMVDKGYAIRYSGEKKTHQWCVDQQK